jgi:hypothetical protein
MGCVERHAPCRYRGPHRLEHAARQRPPGGSVAPYR